MYIQNHLPPYLFGFRKGHSTEQCLVIMLEEWEKAPDKKDSDGAILTDLSKAFDNLNHGLLIAKLSAYGFDDESLEFIHSYLKERETTDQSWILLQYVEFNKTWSSSRVNTWSVVIQYFSQ